MVGRCLEGVHTIKKKKKEKGKEKRGKEAKRTRKEEAKIGREWRGDKNQATEENKVRIEIA